MPKHPYSAYEHDPAWAVVRRALAELEENGDFSAATAEAYLVGYLVKALEEAGCLKGAVQSANPGHHPCTLNYHPKRRKPGLLQQVSEDPPRPDPKSATLRKFSGPGKSTLTS